MEILMERQKDLRKVKLMAKQMVILKDLLMERQKRREKQKVKLRERQMLKVIR